MAITPAVHFTVCLSLQPGAKLLFSSEAVYMKTGTTGRVHTVPALSAIEGRVDAASRSDRSSLRSEVPQRFGGATCLTSKPECSLCCAADQNKG